VFLGPAAKSQARPPAGILNASEKNTEGRKKEAARPVPKERKKGCFRDGRFRLEAIWGEGKIQSLAPAGNGTGQPSSWGKASKGMARPKGPSIFLLPGCLYKPKDGGGGSSGRGREDPRRTNLNLQKINGGKGSGYRVDGAVLLVLFGGPRRVVCREWGDGRGTRSPSTPFYKKMVRDQKRMLLSLHRTSAGSRFFHRAIPVSTGYKAAAFPRGRGAHKSKFTVIEEDRSSAVFADFTFRLLFFLQKFSVNQKSPFRFFLAGGKNLSVLAESFLRATPGPPAAAGPFPATLQAAVTGICTSKTA